MKERKSSCQNFWKNIKRQMKKKKKKNNDIIFNILNI